MSKTFKEAIEEFEFMAEKIDIMAPNYGVNVSQLRGLLQKLGNVAKDDRSTGHFVDKDNGRELLDDIKIIQGLIKKLRRGI